MTDFSAYDNRPLPEDMRELDFQIHAERCLPFTLTYPERLYALYSAVKYVAQAGVPGALVECGVWRGGSVMMMAETLTGLGIADREIYLFDTFEGMTPPTDDDREYSGRSAAEMLAVGPREQNLFWAYASLEDVQRNLGRTRYPADRFHCVKGDVLDTIPQAAPEQIALLRLDTDWYESTAHEMEHLFPRLARNGVLIVDDYGHFEGARKAIDEYLAKCGRAYLMNRIDYTGRLIVKTE